MFPPIAPSSCVNELMNTSILTHEKRFENWYTLTKGKPCRALHTYIEGWRDSPEIFKGIKYGTVADIFFIILSGELNYSRYPRNRDGPVWTPAHRLRGHQEGTRTCHTQRLIQKFGHLWAQQHNRCFYQVRLENKILCSFMSFDSIKFLELNRLSGPRYPFTLTNILWTATAVSPACNMSASTSSPWELLIKSRNGQIFGSPLPQKMGSLKYSEEAYLEKIFYGCRFF